MEAEAKREQMKRASDSTAPNADNPEKLQEAVAKKLGYKLIDHKLELYGSKIKK